MREIALAKKLLWISVGSILLTVVLFSGILWSKLSSSNAQTSSEAETLIVSEVDGRLTANAAAYGEKIAAFINEAYRIPYSLGSILEDADKTSINRESVALLNRSILESNDVISSIYSQFEKNGFDGKDSDFTQGYDHSVAGAGTLEVYLTRNSNGVVEQQVVEDASEKYVDKINEFGLREAEWYLCAKDKLKPCIMEPYLYEITPGYSEMMTSLVVPIIKSGQFVGVTGADITLPVFQKLTEELSKALYDGKAKVTLLSHLGLIVGTSHYKEKLGRPLKEAVSAKSYESYKALKGTKGTNKQGAEIMVSYPIEIKLADVKWMLLIEVPAELAFEGPIQLTAGMSEAAKELGVIILITGTVIAVLAFIVMKLVVGSVVAPLKQIQERVDNLASSEGDLTQTLHVDTHAELIALAGGFNKFYQNCVNLLVS